MKKVLWAAASIALISTSTALASEDAKTDPDAPLEKDWPPYPRPKSEVFQMEVSEDGPPQKRLVFDCGRFALITGNYGNWEEQKPTARFSFQLSPKNDAEVIFGMARFPQNDFIASLDQEEWDTYIAALQNNPTPRAIRNQRLSTDRKAAPKVLDERPYRLVDYEHSDSDGNSTRTSELFTFLDGELFVFALSGPSDKVEQYRERVNLMISRMDVLK
jgi:hypothetical protein